MKRVQLSEVAEFINGRAFKPEEWETEGLPIIRIQNLTGSTDTVNYYSGDVESKYLVKDDDILISWSASLGVYRWQGGDAILNQHIFKVELKEKLIDKDYFYYAAQNALAEMERHIHGATMQHITRDPFLAIEIPLPPLTEQKRIASLLARADRLRHLRRTAHDLGESLLQSVFLEMFGDLTVNQKNWDLLFLEDIADVHGGIQVTSTRNSMKLQKPYLRVANVFRNQLDLSEIKMIGLTPSEFERTKLKKDDLLFVEGHGNINEIGRAAVWDGSIEDCVHQNHLICARLDLKLANPVFVSHYVNSPAGKNYFTNISNTTSGLNTISTNTVKSCPIPVPPLNLQEEFAGVVARVESLRGRMSESERQVEDLFESLLSESFGA